MCSGMKRYYESEGDDRWDGDKALSDELVSKLSRTSERKLEGYSSFQIESSAESYSKHCTLPTVL